jgi:hypothetical protein
MLDGVVPAGAQDGAIWGVREASELPTDVRDGGAIASEELDRPVRAQELAQMLCKPKGRGGVMYGPLTAILAVRTN